MAIRIHSSPIRGLTRRCSGGREARFLWSLVRPLTAPLNAGVRQPGTCAYILAERNRIEICDIIGFLVSH
jgi:hypothetical protein